MAARAIAALLATLWLLGGVDSAAGAAGEPDPSFGGGDGFTILDEPVETNEVLNDVLIRPDGRVLGGGARGGADGFLLALFTADGSPDSSFGGDGIQVEPDTNVEGAPRSIAGIEERPDGRVVAAGLGRGPGGKNAFQFARYLDDGSLDAEFGNNGLRTVPITPFGSAHGMALAPFEKVVAVGDTEDFAVVVRVTEDGLPDASFNVLPTGVRTIDVPGTTSENAAAVEVLADSTVVTGGGAGTQGPFLAELDAAGQPVPGFGIAGIRTYDVGTEPNQSARFEDLSVLADGRIVAAGQVQIDGSDTAAVAVRVGPDGELDQSFGVNGVFRHSPTPGREEVTSLQVLPDGKLLLAGLHGETAPETGDTWLLRLTPDGKLDTGFGSGGETVAPALPGPVTDQAESLAVQPDGRPVVAGWANPGGKQLMVGRFTVDDPQPRGPEERRARCRGKRATIVGTPRNDRIKGTRRRDVIAALAGNDKVQSLGGNDVVCGGAGAEVIKAGKGKDTLLGQGDRDILVGGANADRLLGGALGDRLYGGRGKDTLLGGAGNERLVGGAGRGDVCNGGPGPRDRARGGCERLKKVP